MNSDSAHSLMSLALEQALKISRLDVYPNPRVGAAIELKEGQRFACATAPSGRPHAEARLFEILKSKKLCAQGATMAVTLEPCSHFGQTAPCADAVIQAGIKKIYVGVVDPFKKVNGRGLQKMREAGIEVIQNVMAQECLDSNKEWLFAHKNKRSYVYLKMATSMDGQFKSANGESQWITSAKARQLGHDLRAQVDAIVTSSVTYKKDDPSLTARLESGALCEHQPQVFVLSRQARSIDPKSKLAQHPRSAQCLEEKELKIALEKLFDQGVHSALIEAGPKLCAEFIRQGLVNELWHFFGATYLGATQATFAPFYGGDLPKINHKIISLEFIDNHNYCVRLALES